MRIVMVGAGYVGLVSGACFSEFGWDVVCVDNDADKIAMLSRQEMPIYEPGLGDLIKRNIAANRVARTVLPARSAAVSDFASLRAGDAPIGFDGIT